ncbi:hypothetical protein P167DRAFT_553365 [Morchella conica CCBAS932]|uniref:SAM domain-containing protein n=2 Tax=Morchella sect. Distantes TaxID=1051054 RepID=A0A3N4KTN8_9PEZI|nr:hypothetical protein P167DRAFT_553365 [Morchella conica CCBAS932]
MESAAEDDESEDSESESIRSLGARARMMTEMLSDSDGSIGRRSIDGGLTFSLSEYDESYDVPSTPPALPEYSAGNFQMVEISDEKSPSMFRSYSLNTPPASSHDSICTIGPKGPHLFRSFSTSHQSSLPHITIPRLSVVMPPTPSASVSPASPPALPSPSQFQQPPSAIDESLPYLFREPELRPMSELSQVVSDYDIDEIRSWTPRQVCAWMTALGVERELVDKFERNDISGAILIDLKWEDLKELDIQSFGKRIELWSEIHHLRTRTATSPMAGEPFPRAASRTSRRSSPRTSPVPTPKSSPRIPQTPMGRGSSHSVNEIPQSERRQEKETTEREDSSDEERAPRPLRTQIRKRARRTTARVPKSKHYDSMASESAGMSDADSTYLHQVKYMPSIRAVEEGANRQKAPTRKRRTTVGPNDSISVVSKTRRNKNIEDFTSFGPNNQKPKPVKLHKCSKGEKCRKHGQPVTSKSGERRRRAPAEHGTIFIATTPSIADASALPRLSIFDGASRPTSMVAPSIIASSDVLGPSQRREVKLKQNTLKDVGRMDPLENVKQFLTLQHLQHLEERRHSPPPVPTKSAEDLARAHLRGVMPPMTSPPLSRSESAPPPTSSHSSNGSISIPIGLSNSPPMASLPVRSMTPMSLRTMGMERACPPESSSPPMSMRNVGTNMMRTTTPFSEADVPIYSTTPPPNDRNQSQSVPPDMRYRRFATPDRAQFNPTPLPTTPTPVPVRRGTVSSQFRPAPIMTAVDENAEWELVEDDEEGTKMAPAPSPQRTHSGWMKKRRTNWFRHEWPDYHFVLKGTRLGYARHMEKEDGFIEMENYSVACSTSAGHKLSAAFKGSKLFGNKKGGKDGDCGAFFFQLVPAAPEPGKSAIGKVHHFAVGSREERIDWMRELMLAKAIKQKKEGFEVEVNGEKM